MPMGQFTYNGPGERVYPDVIVDGAVLVAQSGSSYALDVAPTDGFWVAVPASPQAPQTAPEAPTSPANPED